MGFTLSWFLGCTVGILSYAAPAPDQVRIEVKADWGRYVNQKWKVSKSRIVITGTHGIYRAAGRRVSSQAVQNFLAALREPSVARPSLENCGIDAIQLGSDLGVSKGEAQRWFASEFDTIHLDNEHSLRATVTVDGATLVLGTGSDHQFMLPWKAADEIENYNCHISRTLAALLPEQFLNKDLLSGAHLRDAMTHSRLVTAPNDSRGN